MPRLNSLDKIAVIKSRIATTFEDAREWNYETGLQTMAEFLSDSGLITEDALFNTSHETDAESEETK